MKTSKKQNNPINKEIKTKKKPQENEYDTTSMTYFRLLKEVEKKNNPRMSEESQQKEEKEEKGKNEKKVKKLKNVKREKSKPKNNITELIYSKNAQKLGNYYNKNKNDLLLYGNSKYDVLPMDKVLQEMGNYKSKVINKIQENKNNKNCSNSEINNIINDYDNCNNKVILTPLADNEKERSEMESLEKKILMKLRELG